MIRQRSWQTMIMKTLQKVLHYALRDEATGIHVVNDES